MSMKPGSVVGLPITAASRPRFWLTSTDSCGDCMAGVTSVAVRTGLAGSLTSTTATPAGPSCGRWTVWVGNSSVVS